MFHYVTVSAPFPPDERERLRALARYSVLDTPPEEAFDEITALAAEICGTPIALVSLVDAHRQWFKSKVGLDADETPRELAFCAHAILGDAIFEVPNALDDPRFADNPLVTGAPDIRFYAGAPLVTNDGFRLGTLCVIDRVPRSLDAFQLRALRTLGRQVISQLELRATAAALARRLLEAEARDVTESSALADAATDGMSGRTFLARVTHDLRTPLNAILGFAEYLGEDAGMDDAERRAVAGNIREAGGFMLRLVNDILDLASLDAGAATFTRAPVDLAELAASTLEGVRPLASARGDRTALERGGVTRPIVGDAVRIRQVLFNLLSNACKYTQDGEIRVRLREVADGGVEIDVADTGIGMDEAQVRQLFRPFAQVQGGRQSREGTGLGLHITRALVEGMGGSVSVASARGVGTTFTVWLPREPVSPPRGAAVAIASGDPRARAALQRVLGGVVPLCHVDGVAEMLWTTVDRRWRAVIVDASAQDAEEVEIVQALARACAEGSMPMVVVGAVAAGAGVRRWQIGDEAAALREAVSPPSRGEG